MPYYCNYFPTHRNLSNLFFCLCGLGGPVDSGTSLTLLSSVQTVRSCRLLQLLDSAIVWSNCEVLWTVLTLLTLLLFRHVCVAQQNKKKAVPLQAWSGPEACRKFRFPDYITTTQDGGKVVSLTHRPALPPENAPGTHFCQRLSRPQGHSAIARILCQ